MLWQEGLNSLPPPQKKKKKKKNRLVQIESIWRQQFDFISNDELSSRRVFENNHEKKVSYDVFRGPACLSGTVFDS